MSKQILLVNDMAGYGKVALSAMIPILSHMKINIYNLPTALVSNTLDYGKFDILDTTDYMKNSLLVWEQLGFSFDAIATGFIVGKEQADLIAAYCEKQSRAGVTIFCDPIMGDEGRLYNGMSQETVCNMRRLISCSDYIMPNFTEAAFLAGVPYKPEFTEEECRSLICRLREMGAKSVILTSMRINGKCMVACYDAKEKDYFELPYEEIPVRFPGTGDIFSSVLIGGILNGRTLRKSTQKAMDVVKRLIELNLGNEDKYKGILIESYLEVLNEQEAENKNHID